MLSYSVSLLYTRQSSYILVGFITKSDSALGALVNAIREHKYLEGEGYRLAKNVVLQFYDSNWSLGV